jgi:AAA+ superfamily predicted ATPase
LLSNYPTVFLRKIEYFEGIIILTTNLVHVIDQAFESRITICIQFEKVLPDERRQIWQKLLERVPIKRSDTFPKAPKDSWVDKELNGRQIRNIISSAILLAKSRNCDVPILLETDIEDMLTDTMGFITIISEEKARVENDFLSQWSTGF